LEDFELIVYSLQFTVFSLKSYLRIQIQLFPFRYYVNSIWEYNDNIGQETEDCRLKILDSWLLALGSFNSGLSIQLNNIILYRKLHQINRSFQVDLFHDVVFVCFDGTYTNEKFFGNNPV